MTRSGPNGASTTTSTAARGMLCTSGAAGQGSWWRSTRPTGRRESTRLPNCRRPSLPGRSTAGTKNAS